MIKKLFQITLILCFAATSLFANIELKKECSTAGDLIRLSDLVKDSNSIKMFPEITFGNAPLPGRTKLINKEYVLFKLEQSNIDIKISNNFIIPGKIKISTPYQGLNISNIENNIINHISSVIKKDYDKYSINILKISNKDYKLPVSELEYKVRLNRRGQLKGKVVGFVDILIEDKKFKTINFVADIKAWKNLLVAEKNLKFNDVITKGSVSRKLIEVTKLNINNAVTDDEHILLKAAKQRIFKDSVIKYSDLKEPNAVKYGSIIEVIVIKKGFKIKTKAKALQSGAIGEKIRLLNVKSKKTFFAKISNINEAVIR